MDQHKCDSCGVEVGVGGAYEYPDGTPIALCEEHADGLFCLLCGAFIGGTEEVFVYGGWACADCAGEIGDWEGWEADEVYD